MRTGRVERIIRIIKKGRCLTVSAFFIGTGMPGLFPFFRLYVIGRLPFEYDVARYGVGRFLYIADEGAVYFDLAVLTGFAVPGGQFGCGGQLGIGRLCVVAGQDDVGAGTVLYVEPQVVGMGFFEGQEIVLPVVAANPDVEAVYADGEDILGKFAAQLVLGRGLDESHLAHFYFNIGDFRFRTGIFQGVFQGVEIIEIAGVFFVQFPRFLDAVAHLGIALVVAVGVVRHGVGRIEGNGDRSLLRCQDVRQSHGFFVVVFFVGVDHEQVAVVFVRVHLGCFFHFGGDALDFPLLFFNEFAYFFLELFLFPAQAAVGRLIVAQVFFDEVEVAARILGQAAKQDGKEDFLAPDGVDVGTAYALKFISKGDDSIAPGVFLCSRQVRYGGVFVDVCAEGQFVEDDGAHAVEAFEHPLVQGVAAFHVEHFPEFGRRKGKRVHALEIGREFVRFFGGNGADGVFSFSGLDEGFDDDAVFRKDDVAVFAHEFDVDFAGHQAAGDVQDIDVDVDEAVQVELADRGDAAVFIVFAQEHAQSCRGVRRRRHGLGYIEARCVVEGDDQVVDAFVVEDAEIQGPGVELVNFGYGTSLKEGDEFVCDAMQGNTV